MARKSFSATRSKRREARLPHNQLLDAEGTFYVPGHCPDRPDAVHLDRLDVGSYSENADPQDEEKPEQNSDEQDHREAA
jgi:hypothetical protein